MGFLLTSLDFPGPITLSLSLSSWACHKLLTFLVYNCLGPAAALSHFSTSYSAHGMLLLSFLVSLSPLAFSRPIYSFVGPVIHYSCSLGLMGSLLFILSILCDPHYWAFLSAGLPQMALNNMKGQNFFFSNIRSQNENNLKF